MASAARSVWNWCVIGHILRFHLELTRVCVLAHVLSCDTGAGEPSWGRDGNGGTGMSQHRRRDEISHGAQRAHMGGSIRHAITARGLFALPLLLALALSSLVVVVAAPQPVDAQRIELDSTGELGEFGDAVDIDGNLAIVSDPGDGAGGQRSGAATILRRNGTNWVQEAKLLGATTDAGFGFDVAISDGLSLAEDGFTDFVGVFSGDFEQVSCVDGSVITGFDVISSSLGPRTLTPLCTPVSRSAAGDVLLDDLGLIPGSPFNDPANDTPTVPALPGSVEYSCGANSVVVGFSVSTGTFLDGFEFTCATVASDGTVGAAGSSSFAFGAPVTTGLFECSSGIATSVSGDTGDDIDSFLSVMLRSHGR